MAFDPSPATWLGAGYTLTSSVAGFNTNTAGSNKLLKQLTDTLGDETTGDIRVVMMAMAEAFYQAWQNIAAVDRPGKMTITKSSTSGQGSTTVFTYTLKFIVDPTAFTMAAE